MRANFREAVSLNNVRLRNKMLIVYFLSVLIPVVLTNVIFYNITTNNVKKQKLRDISLAMEQIRNDFKAQIDAAVGISSVIYNDAILNEYLETHYEVQSDYVLNYQSYIKDMLGKYSPVYQTIQQISVYTNNDTIIYGGQVRPITGQVRDLPWYRSLSASGQSNPVVLLTDSDYPGTSGWVLSVVRKITVGSSARWDKAMKIDMSPESVQALFRNITLQGDLYLLDGDQVQFTTNPDFERLGTAEYSSLPTPKGTIVMEEAFPNVSYLSSWRIVGHFKEADVLEEVYKSRNFVLYLAIPNVIMPTLIIIWFVRSLNARLIRILKHMKRVKNQSFETIEQQESKDEIGQLTAEFNRMTLQIKSLIHDVYMADIQKKELELKRNQSQLHALQSQINPHFLFNSLEAIRMRSLMKKEEETAKIIHNMAKIFRKSLEWGKDWVTVKDELDLAATFLEIQKYRFGDKLDFRIEADDSVLGLTLPKMTLQPLVENASIHGIEKMRGNGRIDVRIERERDELVCEIRDNGVGMDEEKIKRFYGYMEGKEAIGDRVGVQNVIYRLKLIFGDRFGLRVESAPGEGTSIILRIPIE
ncbi:sensor histidine kinase [Paenibacillus thailandensis]|uniref:Sensor histidine kinase n=1 Tax=Paenibacillus thailandensis TaxID=393250 RepID=A0ABW5QXU6_9BACL